MFPNLDVTRWKMLEHSAWYSGDPTVLANFYCNLIANNIMGFTYTLNWDLFWARQVKNNTEVGLHVPIAGDIASMSADLLFSESPLIKIVEAHEENAPQTYKKSQEELDNMLQESGFYRKIIECAETCSAIGGGYIKLAWDNTVSPYPIPVVEQADNAIPEFRFGVLNKVTFWKIVKEDGTKIFRLFEIYSKDGSIVYELYRGTSDTLGTKIDINTIEETQDYIDVQTQIPDILAVYIPNMLPNRLDRTSNSGRSDYSGIEGLMDALDETYSSWMTDVLLARAKILLPEEFLRGENSRFDVDKLAYTRLDIDPVSEGKSITPVQFAIRAEEFEKTTLNLLERIISASGYSPQSLGLNIHGRAESGLALTIRERKSLVTKNKKENYWEPALKKIIKLMTLLYRTELGGKIETDVNISVSFSDSMTNDINETSMALQKIQQAQAASVDTKVRILHPDWSEEEIKSEIERIHFEYQLAPLESPYVEEG